MKNEIDIASLQGEILTHIDVGTRYGFDEILLTTASGRVVSIFHDQNCCESVVIESTTGEWRELLGKVLVCASMDEVSNENPSPGDYSYSWTRTTLTFQVDDATVINRWIGESNGYYSETISLYELQPSELVASV